jgi:PEGA domain-containing protein
MWYRHLVLKRVALLFGLTLSSTPASAGPTKAAIAVSGMATDSKEAAALVLRIRAALAKRADVELISPSEEEYWFRSARPKRRRSKANLRAAQKHTKQAEASFQAFDFGDAQRSLQRARSLIAEWTGTKEALEIDRERLQLAIATAHAQRDERSLKEALAEYAVRFPNEPAPPGLWPPDVANRLKAIAPADSVLNIRSEPKGLVYIDGREVGNSPVRLGALPEGTHRVEVFLAGYFAFDEQVETASGRESLLEVKLLPDLSSKLKKAKLDREYPQEIVDAIRAVTQPLGVKLVIAAGLDADGKIAVRRIDFEAPSAATLSDAVKADNSPDGAALAISQLFERPDRAAATASSRTVPTWAWIGGGAGAAAVGVGVILRLMAVSTHREFDQRQGALTQAEAYGLRDRAESQANGGAALLGLGVATIAGIAGWVALDFIPPRQGS